MSETEEWRPYPLCPRYEVSSLGNVRNLVNIHHPERSRPHRVIKPFYDKDGYLRVTLGQGGKNILVHRVVYSVFCGELLPGLVVCHLDGSRTNNHPSNLMQTTQRENVAHKVAHGTHQVGEKNGNCKHSNSQMFALKVSLEAAPRSKSGKIRNGALASIAREHGVTYHAASHVARGTRWRNV